MANPASAQTWIDSTLFPFQHQYTELNNGTIHYIDEGEGEVLLFVHGTPTWSFLWRDFVRELSGSYRCIAVDHLGFGLSVANTGMPGTPAEHTKNLAEFMEQLELDSVTLVVHDFGGPIGLGAALQQSERIQRVVLFNSWLWSAADEPEVQRVDKLVNSGLGRFLYLKLNFSPRVLLKKGYHNKRALTKPIHRHYLQPFKHKPNRLWPYALAQALMGASDWYQQQWNQLQKLESKPWLILWGKHDPYFNQTQLERWQNRLPAAEIHQLESGHFVQEEAAPQAIERMRSWLNSTR